MMTIERTVWASLLGAFALLAGATGTAFAGPSAHRAVPQKSPPRVTIVVSDTHAETGTHMGGEEGRHAEDAQGHHDEIEEGHGPGTMSMTVDPAVVSHGKVRLVVENTGSELHEVVILKTKKSFDALSVNSKHKVSEATAVGEVPLIAAGKTKAKTFTLKRGKYALVCNLTEHYESGMRAALTVT